MANFATDSAPRPAPPAPDGEDPVAVLDLGSNTILLLVLSRDGRVLYDDAEITRLGEGVFTRGALAEEAGVAPE